MKKIIKLIITCCFVYSLLMCHTDRTFAEEEEFTGTKKLTYEIMVSDINNYCAGGRNTLEVVLRRALPQNISYDIEQADGRMQLTFLIDFKTYEEYVDAHRFMLEKEPPIIYANGAQLTIMEDFDDMDMLKFLDTNLAELGACTEVDFSWMAVDKDIELNVNDRKYTFEDQVSIMEMFLFDKEIYFKRVLIDISKKEKVYSAYINVWLDGKLCKENVSKAYKSFIEKQATYVNVDEDNRNGGTYKFELEANTIEELYSNIRKYVGVYIGETNYYDMSEPSQTKLMKKIILSHDGVLNDDAHVSMVYRLCEDYSAIKAGNKNTDVGVDRITLNGSYVMEYYENVDMGFEEIQVVTYYTDDWGNYSRDIIFKLPFELYTVHDEDIRKELESILGDGIECNIYDGDAGSRCYKVSILKATMKEVETFTKALLGENCKFKVNKAFMGLGNDKVTDIVSLSDKVLNITSPKVVKKSYISDAGEKKLIEGESGYAVKHSRHQDMLAMVSVILVIAVVIVYIIVIVKVSVKSKKDKVNNTKVVVDTP